MCVCVCVGVCACCQYRNHTYRRARLWCLFSEPFVALRWVGLGGGAQCIYVGERLCLLRAKTPVPFLSRFGYAQSRVSRRLCGMRGAVIAVTAILAVAAVRTACALSVYQVTRAPDTDLRTIDLAAFNVSTALMVFVDDLVFAATRATIEERAGCASPPFARYTPYRFRVDWARTGTLAVWEPVDPSGRMIARGLEWWKCTDRDAAAARRLRLRPAGVQYR